MRSRADVRWPARIDHALTRSAASRNRRRLLALNDRHPGSTIVIVGSSTQINTLSPEHLALLGRTPTIGLNRTQYRVRPRYFLSAYSQEIGLALEVGTAEAVLHMCNATVPKIPGTLAVFKRVYEDDRGLPRRLHGAQPTLYMKRNVALAATHLALVMGARRIIYIGLEQFSNLRFYDEDQPLRERIIADLGVVAAKGLYEVDHPRSTYERHIRILKTPVEQLAKEPYWHEDHTPAFRAYFDELDRYGVEPIATSEKSVVYDAGARYVELDEAFDRFLGGPAPSRPRARETLDRDA
jgi:hypothetical protein